MNPRIIVALAALLLVAAGYFFTRVEPDAAVSGPEVASSPGSSSVAVVDRSDPSKLVVYKSPTCGCCGAWIEHMEKAGFTVEVHDMNDVTPVKEEMGVAPRLRSCHTAVIAGYVIEGHVPADQVTRLLAERPEIRGLAVPGMPIGSPGMDEGYDKSTWQDYDVIAIGSSGDPSVFAHIKATP